MDFRKILEECKADSLVFFTDGSHVDENFYYFTGLSKSIQVTSTVIVTRNGPVIVTNRLEAGIFRGKKEIIENREDAEKAMRKHAGKKVGIDYSSITARRFMHFRRVLKGRKITDISKNMEAIRSVKDRHEIIKIREACRIAEEILDDMGALVRKSRTEKDLAAELDYAARRNDAEALSFPPIVASGKNSAIPQTLGWSMKVTALTSRVSFASGNLTKRHGMFMMLFILRSRLP
ncbi:MAG: aminopeptidase P family protein [Candidatus Aenigmarchaeota archaeon]|nr:aminopeptidase P family protein [Candidatus Aenigmarchaeota archaeon]